MDSLDKNTNEEHLKKSLISFGFTPEEAMVYLVLLQNGWLTVLELSRKISIKRPTLYRMIETLVRRGVLEVKLGDKTTHYTASNPDQLSSVVAEKEQELKDIKTVYGDIVEALRLLQQKKAKETDVMFYRDKRGIEYAVIQECRKQDDEVYILDTSKWYKVTKDTFAEEIRERMVKNHIRIFELQNEDLFTPIPSSGEVSWTKNKNYMQANYLHRLLPKKLIHIMQDMVLFDDSIQFFGYKKGELFVIEIKDEDLSSMLRQNFRLLWNLGLKKDRFGGKNL